MWNVYPIFRDLRQFLHIVTLMSEVLLPNLQLCTPSFVFTCRFYKVFGRYLLCCVRIGLDWIQLLGHQLDWTGLGSVTRGFGLDWIASTQSISYSGLRYPRRESCSFHGWKYWWYGLSTPDCRVSSGLSFDKVLTWTALSTGRVSLEHFQTSMASDINGRSQYFQMGNSSVTLRLLKVWLKDENIATWAFGTAIPRRSQ